MFCSLLSPLCLFMQIAKGLFLLILVTIAWRSYKILYGRKQKRPVRAQEVVLVTGSTAGIGLAVTRHFYEIGYTVLATYCFKDEPGYAELEALAKQSKGNNNKQQFILQKLDVRSQESIKETFKFVSDLVGQSDNGYKLYAVVNNAGIGSLQPFSWMKRDLINDIIQTNLIGTLQMSRQFMPLLIKSKGRLVNVSSGLGYIPGPTYIPYGITKVGSVYFTRALNMELAASEHNYVKAICISPANFIKHTNICIGNLEHVEACWAEMSELERKLYKTEFDKHCKLSKSLDVVAKDHHKAQKALSKTRRTTHQQQSSETILELLTRFLNTFRGLNTVMTVEESGLLDCFEDALRLENPPEHIMAGDNFFNIVGGSIFLSLPINCINFLGKVVAPSLYK